MKLVELSECHNASVNILPTCVVHPGAMLALSMTSEVICSSVSTFLGPRFMIFVVIIYHLLL